MDHLVCHDTKCCVTKALWRSTLVGWVYAVGTNALPTGALVVFEAPAPNSFGFYDYLTAFKVRVVTSAQLRRV